jgi:hypothetical protein
VLRGRPPVGRTDAGALVGPGPVPRSLPVHAAIPGSGVVLGRAINAEFLQGTMAEGGRVAYTTGHTVGLFRGGLGGSPQQFVRMTTQGSPQTKDELANATGRVRLARRSLNRNRGLAPGR